MEKEIWVFCCGDSKFEHDFWKFVEENGIGYSGQMAGYPASPDQLLTGFTLVASALSIAASLAKIREWQIAQRKKGSKGKITIRLIKKRKGKLERNSSLTIETEEDEIDVTAMNINELTVKTETKPKKKRSTKKRAKTHRTRSTRRL